MTTILPHPSPSLLSNANKSIRLLYIKTLAVRTSFSQYRDRVSGEK
jgi:hypothetical protein